MKKILLFAPILLVFTGSCRKDRICTCSQNGTELASFNYINVKRSEGKAFCQTQQSQYQTSYPGTTCVLR